MEAEETIKMVKNIIDDQLYRDDIVSATVVGEKEILSITQHEYTVVLELTKKGGE